MTIAERVKEKLEDAMRIPQTLKYDPKEYRSPTPTDALIARLIVELEEFRRFLADALPMAGKGF